MSQLYHVCYLFYLTLTICYERWNSLVCILSYSLLRFFYCIFFALCRMHTIIYIYFWLCWMHSIIYFSIWCTVLYNFLYGVVCMVWIFLTPPYMCTHSFQFFLHLFVGQQVFKLFVLCRRKLLWLVT